MVVLQALAKGNDCQRSFMTLLLEAIVTIFLSTTDGFSPVIHINWDFLLLELAPCDFIMHSFDHSNKWQEIRDLRNTAIKLVSRLAQIPSSAMHFKDVLLSMPPLHRHELQVFLVLQICIYVNWLLTSILLNCHNLWFSTTLNDHL